MRQPQRAYAIAYTDMASRLRASRLRLEQLERVTTAIMGLSLALLVGAAMM